MTLFFLFPRVLWHALPRQSGVNVRRLVKGIKGNTDAQYSSHGTLGCRYLCRKLYIGHTLGCFGLKLLYVTNTISQFFLLNAFLSLDFTNYGVEALKKIYYGEDWFESPRFPRITMCDFMVRRLGSNLHWYSVQCNLSFNMYNEKIFLGIWIWLIILTILNILSIISWMFSLSPPRRLAAIKTYLKVSQSVPEENEILLSSTTNGKREITNERFRYFMDYLRIDGYLIFRLIGRNTDEIVAGKIIKYLYNNFKLPNRIADSPV
jgi:hypothetical protein